MLVLDIPLWGAWRPATAGRGTVGTPARPASGVHLHAWRGAGESRGSLAFSGCRHARAPRSARARRALTTTLCTKRVHVFAHDKRGAFLREIEVRTQRPSADKVCLCAANTRLRSRLCTRKSCGCPCLRRLQIAHVVQNELGWLPRRRGHAKREIVKQNVLFLDLGFIKRTAENTTPS